MTDSCLTRRLRSFIELSAGEVEFIASMERDEQELKRGQSLVSRGDETHHLYVLKWGWAMVVDRKARDRRAILRLYLPGEVIGLAEIGSPTAPHDIVMLTDGMVCPFPRQAFSKIFETAPRLAALFTAIGSTDQLLLRDHLSSVSRMSGEDRLILFMVALLDRLSVAGAGVGARFHLPMSQCEIGDLLGMTPVYISKLMTRLREDGVLELSERHIRLLAHAAMTERVAYTPLASRIDTSWFPKAL